MRSAGLAAVLAAVLAAILVAAPADADALRLPPPGREPQRIDFVGDPLLVFLAGAAPPEAFRTAIADAVTRHPATLEAGALRDDAGATRRAAGSAMFPRLDAAILASRSLASRFDTGTAFVESLQPRGRADAVLGAEQLLWDFGATGARIAAASARLRAASSNAQGVAAATALRAVAAWYDVLAGQALADLSDALVARHAAILADTRARAAAGVGSAADVARAEAGHADAIGDSARYTQALAAARARYSEVFGADAPARPPRPLPPVSSAPDMAAAALMSHATPDVVAAIAGADSARIEARAAVAEALPRVAAGVNASRYDVFGSTHDFDVRGQVSLRQSLSLGGAEAARIAGARARARAAGFASDRAGADAERDAMVAFADAGILDRTLAARETAYRANRRARDAMAEQFRLSRGDLTDVLRAEQAYFAAAAALLQASIDRDMARYTLLARTGELLPLFALQKAR